MSKSYLKLRSECRSTSYDAITSHMVIVAIRYMILAVERFRRNDNRTLVDLFHGIEREMIDKMMGQTIVTIINILLETVQQHLGISDQRMMVIIRDFISRLPDCWRLKFVLPEVIYAAA